MVKSIIYIVDPGVPRAVKAVKHICDECECECHPERSDPRDWLYRFKGQELCWECFMCEAGAEIIE